LSLVVVVPVLLHILLLRLHVAQMDQIRVYLIQQLEQWLHLGALVVEVVALAVQQLVTIKEDFLVVPVVEEVTL
jgi:hypothetical protein